MKYFEVNEPYYALIKAPSKKRALEIYTETISEDDDGTLSEEMMEVNRDYALVKFSRVKGENGEVAPIFKVLETFKNDEAEMLFVDSSLI